MGSSVGPWILDTGPWILDVGRYTLGAGIWTLENIVGWLRAKPGPSF